MNQQIRTLKELYSILLEHFDSNNSSMYLCLSMKQLLDKDLISNEELNFMVDEFEKEKPTFNGTNKEWFRFGLPKSIWFECGDKETRIEFLQYLISKL